MGAWAEAKKRAFELRVIAPMDDDADSVVTMTGRVALEGPYRRRAAALPVQTRDGVTKVDPARGRAVIRRLRPKAETVARRPRSRCTSWLRARRLLLPERSCTRSVPGRIGRRLSGRAV